MPQASVTAGEIVVNLGYVLMLGGFLARDVLWLRLLLVIGQSCVTAYALGVDALPVAIWNGVFAVINGLHAILILRERHGLRVPPELREFYEQTFAALTPGEFLKIWKLGAIETRADEVLVREGERSGQLFFLLDGEVRVEKAARALARLGRGRFLAEMGFLTGEAASADARAVGSVRYMAWDSHRLRQLRGSSPMLWTKLLSALGKDLVNKIKTASDAPAR